MIELLVVVAIIGTLAAVVLASLGGARDSAQVTRMVSDLNQIEKAFQLWGLNEGWTEWPTASSFNQGTSPTINSIIQNTNFDEYLPQAPTPSIGSAYGYFKASDDGNCGTRGSYIFVRGDIPVEIKNRLDEIIDNDEEIDLNCGKLRSVGSNDTLVYVLANSI